MIPSLLEQVRAAKVPSATALAIMDKMDDNLNRLAEWMTGRNVTVASAAQALEVSEPTMREWLKRLVFRRRVISWTVKRKLWFTLSQAEITARRRMQ